jgi:hypothetical protein
VSYIIFTIVYLFIGNYSEHHSLCLVVSWCICQNYDDLLNFLKVTECNFHEIKEDHFDSKNVATLILNIVMCEFQCYLDI